MKQFLILIIAMASCIGNESEKKEDFELQVLWSRDTNTVDVPDASPLIIEDSKIVYTGEIELVAVDEETGDELWRGVIDNESALISEKLLYDSLRKRIITNHKKDIKVWNSETGESIFTLTAEDGVQSFHLGRHTVLKDGYGIIGDTLDAYVINPDGSTRFSVQFAFASAGLAFWNDKLYMTMGKTITGALTKGKIVAFDVQTGDSLWGFNTDKGGFTRVAPVIEQGVLYAGTLGNSPRSLVIALEAQTGGVLWEYMSSEGKEFTESLLLSSNHVLFGASGRLVALNKETGKKAWEFNWTSSTLVKPVYLEGYIYHSDHGRLFVIDVETGELVHEEPSPGGFIWHVAASSDKIFVQTSNQLIAYQPWHLREE